MNHIWIFVLHSLVFMGSELVVVAQSNHSNVEASMKDSDDEEDMDLKARWSYLPWQVERFCSIKCGEFDKPFGRLIGTQCQCLCPLNAPDFDLCSGAGPDICYGFCERIGYRAGGDCLYNSKCFCFCKKLEEYDVTKIYTTPASLLKS